MVLKELIAGLNVRPGGCIISGVPGAVANDLRRFADVRICDLTEDSRTVVPGSMFVARAGEKSDGKQYLVQALQAGAVAVLCDDPIVTSPRGFDVPVLYAPDVALTSAVMAERFYGAPSASLKLAGVTGTNGKTTTTYLIWQLMNSAGSRCGLVGTVVVDDGREVANAAMTTPPAIELSRTLSSMVESGCAAAALEASSHALDQKRVDALRFHVGVYTNLTGDHLDYHKGIDDYARAKARLFELLPPEGAAVINGSDWYASRMVRRCKAPVLRCAVTAGGFISGETAPECQAEVVEESIAGMRLLLRGPWGLVDANVPLVGRYNAMNVLQATAACHAMGLSAEDVQRGLLRVTAPPGRLERVSDPDDPFHVFVDYAHSDDSLRNVLTAAGAVMLGRRHAGALVHGAAGAPVGSPLAGKLRVVFGCGGDRDTSKRPRMGLAAVELADVVIVTSDNPRRERPSDIVDHILAGVPEELRHKVTVQVDRERAIRAAIESAEPGDVVIIAGKGHETDQILPDGAGGTVKIHFDDREVARTVLAQRRPPAPVEKRARSIARVGAARGGRGARPEARWGKKREG